MQGPQAIALWVSCLGALACSESTSSSSPRPDSGQSNDGGLSHDSTVEPDDAAADCVAGSYVITLNHVSGTCGAVDESLMVALTSNGVRTTTEMRLSSIVVTMTAVSGCSVRFQRQVMTIEGVLSEDLVADELELESAGTLEGEAELTRFENGDDTCSSTYQMTLHRI